MHFDLVPDVVRRHPVQLARIAMMVSPPQFIRDGLTSLMRIAVGSVAVVVLLTNPWTVILYVVMRGGSLS